MAAPEIAALDVFILLLVFSGCAQAAIDVKEMSKLHITIFILFIFLYGVFKFRAN